MAPRMLSSGDLIADRRYGIGRELAGRGDWSAAADLFEQAQEFCAIAEAQFWLLHQAALGTFQLVGAEAEVGQDAVHRGKAEVIEDVAQAVEVGVDQRDGQPLQPRPTVPPRPWKSRNRIPVLRATSTRVSSAR